MLDFTPNDLKTVAEKILDMQPDPVPRFRLLRDVLNLNPASNDYRQAELALQGSKWIALLRNSQWPDGTWGRFHTQDTSVKQPFATTEAAISTALDSGLDRHSPILQKVQNVILEYMDGKICWPDPPEKHDNPLAWYVWVRHWSAAVLSQIDPYHPRLDEFWNIWAEAVQASFQSGCYDRQNEIAALNSFMECRMKKPVPFHTKYPLWILSATHHRLPGDLERLLLEFVMQAPMGIYYVYDKPISVRPTNHSKGFLGWLKAHQLLSRFRIWNQIVQEDLNWIWAQRNEHGFWDTGSQVARKPFTSFPLSETWRRPENRMIDSTVEILTLLSRGFEVDVDPIRNQPHSIRDAYEA
jgi:hypothetical protein